MATTLCSPYKTQRFVSPKISQKLPQTYQAPLGFSPHEAHAHQAFFGWIMPTIRTSEFTVLQIVGLDAAVVCDFTIFYLPDSLDIPLIIYIALKFLQNVLLPLFSLFYLCYNYPDASELEGFYVFYILIRPCTHSQLSTTKILTTTTTGQEMKPGPP